ncbi:hypothetical protein D3C80_1195600 [compost metagenome]
MPTHLVADQQVLWLAHQGAHATQGGTHCAVHQQATQEVAELVEVFAVQVGDLLVAVHRAFLARVGAGRDAVVHGVEADRSADDHRRHGQRIEKRRQKRRQHAEQQRQNCLRAHPEQNARKQEQQQLLHEMDAGDHEHQQQDHREVVLQFLVQRLWRGHLQQQGFDQQQAARHQRVALQRHAQGEDEFEHQRPAGCNRANGNQQQRVEHQEQADDRLVPKRRLAQKTVGEGAGQGA